MLIKTSDKAIKEKFWVSLFH